MQLAAYIAIVFAYLFLNSSLNLLNKWALGHAGFRFPFLLTSCHMMFSFLVLAPVALRQPREVHVATLRKQWRGIVYIGSFMALNIALTNVSLMDISLSLSQIIRASIPVVVCVLAILVENRYPSRQEALSLLVLSVGVMLAVWQGAATGKPYAICFAMAATVSNGAMMTFSSKLMSEKLDVVRLAFYVSPVSLTCLAPFFLAYERDNFSLYWPSNSRIATIIILVSSINALIYNLVHALTIKTISAVTTTVLGEIKIVALLVLSSIMLGEGKEWTATMTVGTVLALLGFGAYSQIRMRGSAEAAKKALVAAVSSRSGSASSLEKGLTDEAQPLKKVDSA